MRDLTTIVAGALGGALLAVVIVFAAAQNGMLPMPAGSSGDAIRAYLLAHPELVGRDDRQAAGAAAGRPGQGQAAAAMKKIGMAAFFDPKIAFVTGPADAKKSVVEFYDYDCPYCRASLPAVEKFYQQHKNDTRFSFIEFPIKGPDSDRRRQGGAGGAPPARQISGAAFRADERDRPGRRSDDLCRRPEGGPGHGQAQGRHGGSRDRCRDRRQQGAGPARPASTARRPSSSMA